MQMKAYENMGGDNSYCKSGAQISGVKYGRVDTLLNSFTLRPQNNILHCIH